MALLTDQAWLKNNFIDHFYHSEADKEKAYREKAYSMNMVISILVLIATVLLGLNHEFQKKEEGKELGELQRETAELQKEYFAKALGKGSPTNTSKQSIPEINGSSLMRLRSTVRSALVAEPSPRFRWFIIHVNYFIALLNFAFGLATAEILDTAANTFVRESARIAGHRKQTFFYHRALVFGGAGYYYATMGVFCVLALSLFSLLLPVWLPTATLLIASLFAVRYFFGYYEPDRSDGTKVILRGEDDDPPGPGQLWKAQPWTGSSHLGAYLGGLLPWLMALLIIRLLTCL